MEDEIRNMFLRKKKDICTKLIESGIWKGVDSNKLKAWIKNFSTPQERFFAACVLDWLVYRNEDQVVSMLYDLLTYHLYNQWRLDQNPLYRLSFDNPLIRLQKKHEDPQFRYVTAVTHTDPGTKSGYLMVRLMNQKLEIPAKWNIKIVDLQQSYNNGIKTFIFVDDITGTGEQICSVLKETEIDKYPDTYFYVLVCAAHEKAISNIKKEFPQVKILYAELIPEGSNFFLHVPLKAMDIVSVEDLKEFYVSFMSGKGIKRKNSLGRGDLGLLYAFQHNVPNNSLSILYGGNEPEISLLKLLNKRG